MTGDSARIMFLFGLVAAGFCLYIWLTYSMRAGNRVHAVLAVWASSSFPILWAGVFVEHRSLLDMLNPATQSWAAEFSDSVAFPAAAWIAATGSKYGRLTQFHWRPLPSWVRFACALCGVTAGVAFHAYDSPHYTLLARNSPGMLLHDYLAFPVIFGGMLYGLVMLFKLRYDWRHFAAMLVVIVVGFGGPATADNTFHHLDVRDMHVQLDWNTGKVVPYPNLK